MQVACSHPDSVREIVAEPALYQDSLLRQPLVRSCTGFDKIRPSIPADTLYRTPALRGRQQRLDPHVGVPRDRHRGVVGVKLGRHEVPDLAYITTSGLLLGMLLNPEAKVSPALGLSSIRFYTLHPILDRVLHRFNVLLGRVELLEEGPLTMPGVVATARGVSQEKAARIFSYVASHRLQETDPHPERG